MERDSSFYRKKHLDIRTKMNSKEVEILSEKICDNLYQLLSEFHIDKVLCYYPLGNEVNLISLYNNLLLKGFELYFPKTFENDMDFIKVNNLESDFTLGNFNVMEPIAGNVLADFTNTICLTPGVCFDLECNRIGFGKGFYDRFFNDKLDMVKVGIAFENQMEETIPCHEFDIAMDYCVTENSINERKNNGLN